MANHPHGVDDTWARVLPYLTFLAIERSVVHWLRSVAPAELMHHDGEMFMAWRGSVLMPTLAEDNERRIGIDTRGRVTQRSLSTELDVRIRNVRHAPGGPVWLLVDGADGRVSRVSAVKAPEPIRVGARRCWAARQSDSDAAMIATAETEETRLPGSPVELNLCSRSSAISAR